MFVDLSKKSLIVYKALASPVRLRIIELLGRQSYSVKELADLLNLSQPITLKHVNLLQKAGVIRFKRVGKNKISYLCITEVVLKLPDAENNSMLSKQTDIPVGSFVDYSVEPTCGLATSMGFIGKTDDPQYFLDPARMSAKILWFSKGFVEYDVGNFLKPKDKVKMLTLSGEFGSEVPLSNNDYPSDITFSLNGHRLVTWTSPGDFADTRGKYTPNWTPAEFNQYGTQLTILVSNEGTWIGGNRVSNLTINELLPLPRRMKLRISVEENAEHVGGCTIFGKHFGNVDREMALTYYYI
ncbi:ArsR/SmtB family transcription factor [Secundilactobacillus folii]|uniref:Helix-turn-helix domain-containing protein n=1 Tax=Secundilactobacillus folii TaxID=2678357 RepID=A0A7X2XU89_9LACO|nr:ArsR family transcriptional regulator [Secundilactobacillus folii]MTV81669.1 helix-turn-helix domain-containing protein [Secundilactobacillus folii]